MKVVIPVIGDHTVAQIVGRVNELIEEYDGWTSTQSPIYVLSSRWALVDHLEYCQSDPLDDIEGYAEHLDKNELFFLALIKDEITLDTYDAVSKEAFLKNGDYWDAHNRHVLTV